jgi:hypothetical protein
LRSSYIQRFHIPTDTRSFLGRYIVLLVLRVNLRDIAKYVKLKAM